MTDSLPKDDRIKAAVITGRHPFDVPGFHGLFRSFPQIDAYIQHLEDFASDAGKVRDRYDVVVFYNMHTETPGQEQGWWEKNTRRALEQLGQTQQGIFVLHHALLAFPDWPLWSEIVGIPDRSFGFHPGQTVPLSVAGADHPITAGLSPWRMVDETYTMSDAGADSKVLVTADHPESMKTIAWVRQHRNARVFCFQSGHDNEAFTNPSFRTVVSRGIEWCAGRL